MRVKLDSEAGCQRCYEKTFWAKQNRDGKLSKLIPIIQIPSFSGALNV